MHGGVVSEYTALLHHFLHMSQAQWARHLPAHERHHGVQSIVQRNHYFSFYVLFYINTEIIYKTRGYLLNEVTLLGVQCGAGQLANAVAYGQR
jgi:hypothetical protein